MDALIYLVGALIAGLILFVVIGALVRAPGKVLQQKFVRLGTLKGKTRVAIVAVVGPPSAQSGTPDGGQLLQWMATGYHIALIFDANGICQGVSHEAVV
jgi:hypothetical protein